VRLRFRQAGQIGHSLIADAADIAGSFSAMDWQLSVTPERDDAPTLLLAYWPVANTNRFQSLLYNQCWRYRTACLPFVETSELAEVPWAGEMICHFHWLGTIGTTAEGNPATADPVAEFEALLASLKEQRRKILWTVHNVLPHEQSDIATAVRIRRMMVDAADVIHVMNRSTAALVEPYFSIADKPVFFSPHPSYVGEYPNTVSGAEARFQLGIAPRATVFLCFGAMLRYKGIEDLLVAAEALRQSRPDGDWMLVIAGRADDADLLRHIRSIDTLDDHLIVHDHKIPVEDVQYYFNAADYCVCPYRAALNSGAAMLALSFGVPLIAPDNPTFRDLLERSTGIAYDPGVSSSLVSALAAALDANPATMRANAVALAHERRAEESSARFFDGLMSKLVP
jgi:glycosyltransferase involved in cell wall biosynthesis